jgi:prepilin-type N-terminal cleavage/methylation domain-containing protein
MVRASNNVERGFSLIELILTVALLAILVSIAIPRVGWETMGKVQAETSARNFSDHLKLARSLAITHAGANSNGYRVVLSGGFTSYSLLNGGTSQIVKGPVEIPDGVICSGDSNFTFTPLGQIQGNAALTLQFSKSGDTTAVRVTPVGRITVE